MYKKTFVPFLLLALPFALAAQNGYLIRGKVGNWNAPHKAYLYYLVKGEPFLDSTAIKNGVFTFKGKVGAPKEANIAIKDLTATQNPVMMPRPDLLGLLIENRVIDIVSKDSVKNATIKGSPLNDENAKVTALLKPIYARYDSLNQEYKSSPEEKQKDTAYIADLERRAAATQEEIIAAKMKYANAHLNSYMGLMAFNSTLPPLFDAIAAEKVFGKFDESLRKSDLGENLNARIQKVKVTQDGALAPDFVQMDTLGKPVELSDFKGKWILLDFWASWCAPCRRENPNLLKTYNAFKDKGFTVLGVSLDKPTDRAKWLAAIAKDGLVWTQVSDLKGWESEAAKLYEVTAIPMNFLINPDGKIVARYLRGADLDKKLAEVIK